MVHEFNGFRQGVIGKNLPSDTTLMNMRKSELVKLLHTAQHNYDTLMWFYSNAVNVNMKHLQEKSWIPCSERLPELKQEVLITADDNAVYQGVMANGGFMVFENGWIDTKRTLAWQPLPAPYQKGEKHETVAL